MTIAYLVPGSGGQFYCENCLRDIPLIQALRRQGLIVHLIPLYLPLFSEEEQTEVPSPIFFGAVSYYLHHKYPGLRRLGSFLRRGLSSRTLLGLVARLSGSTQAKGLEDMTLSMISGQGLSKHFDYQALCKHLSQLSPNVLHLSNALLVGLGRNISRDCNIPLTCTLQDEDSWLDALPEPWRTQAYTLLTEGAKEIFHFFPASNYFGKLMQERINLNPERLTVLAPGIDFKRYESTSNTMHPPAIGYLYRIAEPYGLDIVARSFLELRTNPGLELLELHISGGYTGADKSFIRKVRRILAPAIRQGRVHFHPQFGFGQRQRFFSQISVLCVPLRRPEAFGTYVLEALASGIPVVQPQHGAFPEIIAATNGGLCYPPNQGPTTSLAKILLDADLAQKLGQAGRAAVGQKYTTDLAALTMASIFRQSKKEILQC
jgi:glycosyltransferase involved in cell wall biosynthesis